MTFFKVEPWVSGALHYGDFRLRPNLENVVFEIFYPKLNKLVPYWPMKLEHELNSWDSNIVEETIGDLQFKHLFLTKERKDYPPGAKRYLDIVA